MKARPTRKRSQWKRRIVSWGVVVVVVALVFFRLVVVISEDDLLVVGSLPTAVVLQINSTMSDDDQQRVSCIDFPSSSVVRPKIFMENGVGREYLELYHNQSLGNSRRRRLLKVRFVVYHLKSKECRPIYYHIHKNGGSTMNIQGPDLLPGVVGSLQAYYTKLENQWGRERFENETRTILDEAFYARRHEMPIFTFLRDPVDRFISGVGQALKLNQLGDCTRSRTKKDSLELLDCVLNEIQTKKHYLDEHLEPQIFELYHGMMGLDLDVSVMDLTTMDMVLQKVLGVSTTTPRRTTRRNGLVVGYNLSTSLLTPNLVERICSIYNMDVLLLHETKVTVTACPMI